MVTSSNVSDLLLRKLNTRHPLESGDRVAVAALPWSIREALPNAYLMRERQQPTRCSLILTGFAVRQKLAANGGRQIVGVLLPGDFTDLQQLFLSQGDHNVQALTRMTIADIPADALRDLAFRMPAIGRALWTDALVEGSMARELALNIGRRSAVSRVAHLLCEFEARLGQAGLANDGYELPMTQEQLGDATGLTSVHVNRVLKQLDKEALISRKGRFVKIENARGLADRADFDPLYLHISDRAIPADRRLVYT